MDLRIVRSDANVGRTAAGAWKSVSQLHATFPEQAAQQRKFRAAPSREPGIAEIMPSAPARQYPSPSSSHFNFGFIPLNPAFYREERGFYDTLRGRGSGRAEI